MSKDKPDYTKFMRKPAPLAPQPHGTGEPTHVPAEQEIPWAEIVPIQEGEIAFIEPGQIAYFERVDKPAQSADESARPSQQSSPAPSPRIPEQVRAADAPAHVPPPARGVTRALSSTGEPEPLILSEDRPPVPVFLFGITFIVVLVFFF